MSAKRIDKGEVEEPVKKGPVLVISLILILIFLVITGVLLVSWYLENAQDRMEEAANGRVLVSGIAVLTLIVLLVVMLINILSKQKRSSAQKPAPRKRVASSAASPVKRKKNRKTTYN